MNISAVYHTHFCTEVYDELLCKYFSEVIYNMESVKRVGVKAAAVVSKESEEKGEGIEDFLVLDVAPVTEYDKILQLCEDISKESLSIESSSDLSAVLAALENFKNTVKTAIAHVIDASMKKCD